jgi:hypothetical protein
LIENLSPDYVIAGKGYNADRFVLLVPDAEDLDFQAAKVCRR